MSSTSAEVTNRQSYAAHNGATLLSDVASVICLLGAGSALCAGFSADGRVLAVRRAEAARPARPWAMRFYEDVLMSEPLLGDPALLRAVFFADDRLLHFPEALWDEESAPAWMARLWHTTAQDHILSAQPAGSRLHLVSAAPLELSRWIEGVFANAALLPLAAAQLDRLGSHTASLRIAVVDETATVTLLRHGALLWQGCLPCTTPEDAAYAALLLLQNHDISPEEVRAIAVADSPYDTPMLTAMERYLPGLRTASEAVVTHDSDWAPVLTLLHQLRSCVL